MGYSQAFGNEVAHWALALMTGKRKGGYLCDTVVSPLDLYRTLALELGITPSHRRGQLWTDLKRALVDLVDECQRPAIWSQTGIGVMAPPAG